MLNYHEMYHMGLCSAGLVFYHVEDSGVNATVEGHMLICFVLLSFFFLLVENNAINDFGNCLAGSLRLCTVTRFIWSFFSLVTHYFKSGYLLRKLFQITAEKSP